MSPRREYLLNLVCGTEGCSERCLYRYDYKADHQEAFRRYRDKPWLCLRHSQPGKVLSDSNPANSVVFIATEHTHEFMGKTVRDGLFWTPEGSGSRGTGFDFSSAHHAYAKDFPVGTRLVVTAYVETPEQAEIARAVDAPSVPSGEET